jgi:hypothetical protein
VSEPSCTSVVAHLGTLTRNELRFPGAPRHRPPLGRAHQPAAPGLRAYRGSHPAHPAHVVRNATVLSTKAQASSGLGIQTTRNFGLSEPISSGRPEARCRVQ